ncbi:MAG: hypothetical protein RR140_04105, partial [Clostridia bacterium]
MYKTRDSLKTTYDNVYFILPQSYFVELLENNTSEIIKVKYGSIIGYAKQSHLTRVDFIPKKPTLDDVTFNIGNISTQLRKTPDTNDDKIVTILESGTTGINYIAEISGTIPSGQTTSTWYFAEYTPTFDPTSVYRGYVHKSKTIAMGIIEVNLEDNPIINMPDNSQASGKGITKISTTTKIILIVLVTLPSIIIIALLVAHKKKTQNLNDAPVNNLQIPSELLQKHAINKQNGEKSIKQENNSFRLKSKKVKDLEEHIKEFGEKNIDNVRKSDKKIDRKSEEKT